MAKRLDLTGKEFNLIRCLSPAPSKNGKTYWNCQCIKCGQQKIIQTCNIISGSTKTCGCGCGSIERVCPICNKTFIVKNIKDSSRKYCYDCSPPNRRDNTLLFNAIKKKLIELKGGKCQRCGYNKNMTALCFHHRNPSEKAFGISDSSHHTWEELFKESQKCDLLCLNCHAEIHDEINKNNK